ncbi:MAG TPA: hypothetical protein VIL86_14120 [Tepidisphaeraceae bacterium]
MTLTEHGRIERGAIVLSKALPLPEGTEVTVHIEAPAAQPDSTPAADISSLPFVGMWADREDMADSAEWVRKEREQWQLRTNRRD